MNLQSVIASLVTASRLGDQNAMATIERVVASAKEGSPRAVAAKALLENYVRANPPPRDSSPRVAGEAESAAGDALHIWGDLLSVPGQGPIALHRYAAHLSNGPPISQQTVDALAARITSESDRLVFLRTVDAPESLATEAIARMANPTKGIAEAARCLGLAMRIQRVRDKHWPLSSFSAQVGIDLGDDESKGACACTKR